MQELRRCYSDQYKPRKAEFYAQKFILDGFPKIYKQAKLLFRGAGRLTESVINSLQNYYGEAIRSHTESTGYDESCSSLTPTPMNNPVITCAQKVKHLGANGRKTRPKELNTPTRNHHYLLPSSNCYSLFTVA